MIRQSFDFFPPPVEWRFTFCTGRQCSLFSATAPPGREPHYGPISSPQAPQEPPTILQQLPATVMPPGSIASIRPGGHVREGMADCHHTQTKSHDFTLIACLSHQQPASMHSDILFMVSSSAWTIAENVCAWFYVSECVKFMFMLCIGFFFTSCINNSITQIQFCKSVTSIYKLYKHQVKNCQLFLATNNG